MKVILTEDKLFNTIYKYIDSYFDVNDITMDNGLTEDGDNYDEDFFVFYYGEWHGEYYTDMVLNYFTVNYYGDDPSSVPSRNRAPILEVMGEYAKHLDDMFNGYWVEPMKKWFQDNYNLPVKTVTTYYQDDDDDDDNN